MKNVVSFALKDPVTKEVVSRAAKVRMEKIGFPEGALGLSRHDYGNFCNLVAYSNLPQKPRPKRR